MNTRNRTRPTTPEGMQQQYEAEYARLSPRLLTPWQRCAVGLSLLLAAGELPAGGYSTAKSIHALLIARTSTFDGVDEVFRKATSDAVLGSLKGCDRRGRWRHNALTASLGMAKVRGRDALPTEAMLARDADARSTLRRLADRLAACTVVRVPPDPVRLLEQGMPRVELLPGLRPLPPTLESDSDDEMPDDTDTEELPAVMDVGSFEELEPDTQADAISDVVVTAPTLPELPEPEPERIPDVEEDLAAILATGRNPNPSDDTELAAYLLWLRKRESEKRGH